MNARADFWSDQITPGKRKTAANALGEMARSGMFKDGLTISGFRDYFEDNYNATNANEIFEVAGDYLLSNLNTTGRVEIDQAIRRAGDSLRNSNLDLRALYNELVPDANGRKFQNSNDAFAFLTQSENRAKEVSKKVRCHQYFEDQTVLPSR